MQATLGEQEVPAAGDQAAALEKHEPERVPEPRRTISAETRKMTTETIASIIVPNNKGEFIFPSFARFQPALCSVDEPLAISRAG